MKKKLAALAALMLAAALISGCSPISTGTITKKSADAGYFYTSTTCHTSGKTTYCVPSTYWVPPKWTFDLRNGEKTGWVDVDEDTFNAYEVGEVYR